MGISLVLFSWSEVSSTQLAGRLGEVSSNIIFLRHLGDAVLEAQLLLNDSARRCVDSRLPKLRVRGATMALLWAVGGGVKSWYCA